MDKHGKFFNVLRWSFNIYQNTSHSRCLVLTFVRGVESEKITTAKILLLSPLKNDLPLERQEEALPKAIKISSCQKMGRCTASEERAGKRRGDMKYE